MVDFAVPENYRVKLRESEKKNYYLQLNWELKKLCNSKVMVIPMVTGAFGTVNKGLVLVLEGLEIRGREETIQTTVLLRSARKLRSPGDMRKLAVTQSSEIPSVNASVSKLSKD